MALGPTEGYDPGLGKTRMIGDVAGFLLEHRRHMLDDLGRLVERETPSTEKDLLDDFAGFLAEYAESALGARAEILRADEAGDHVRLRWGNPDAGRPVLLLGHYDTVWPAGTLQEMPFEVEGGTAAGPGIFDMKCGLVQGLWAARALREAAYVERPVVLFCNSDEELGSRSSRTLIEEEAREAAAVLVLEPSQDGDLKTARKGAGRFRVSVTGRPAHAGSDPGRGVSAIEELARLTLELHGRSDPRTGTTLNVGVIDGGTRWNTVAAQASAEVGLRVVTAAEAERMTEIIFDLEPHREGSEVRVEGGMIWPPWERTETTVDLFRKARRLANELGFDVGEVLAGGASDGCFCAALGVPVLDGLGAVGGGAHAVDERVEVASMPSRAALVALLMASIGAG